MNVKNRQSTAPRGPDYRIRPAKHVERQLIIDVLRRLRYFRPLSNYSYVGFGAQYFVDFSLLHKALGIHTMTSIEKESWLYDRCVFNRPYGSVQVVHGSSTTHFSGMTFKAPTIAWPDYTGRLTSVELGDLDTLCLRLPSASVVMATVNVEPDTPDKPKELLPRLEKRVGATAVPNGTSADALLGWGSAAVAREIIDSQLRHSVTLRQKNTVYEQLFNFEYRDGGRMLTVGGILLEEADQALFDGCDFPSADGYRPGKDAVRIELPSLTMRELAHLDAQLPGSDVLASPGLAAQELASYRLFYRWYPRYALVDI